MIGRRLLRLLLRNVMNRAACAVMMLIVTSTTVSQAHSHNISCRSLPPHVAKRMPEKGCTCGPHLRNMKFTPPTGMKLVAACGLHWPHMNSRKIDLHQDSISFDEYTNGELPYGILYLDGIRDLVGSALVEPGNSGELWFIPKPDFSKRGLPLGDQMSEFKFLSKIDYVAFRVNEKLLNSECSSARAKIRISGLRIVMGDTDEAGTYPLITRVLKISKYKDCKAN